MGWWDNHTEISSAASLFPPSLPHTRINTGTARARGGDGGGGVAGVGAGSMRGEGCASLGTPRFSSSTVNSVFCRKSHGPAKVYNLHELFCLRGDVKIDYQWLQPN